MTAYEMAKKYYPRLWDINRINTLLEADKITKEEYDEIIKKQKDKYDREPL
jgi:hypothetical protein